MVQGVLRSNGIRALLFDENLNRLNPLISHALGGVRVIVNAKYFHQAEKILRKHLGTSKKAPFTGSINPLPERGRPLAETPTHWWPLLAIAGFLAIIALLAPDNILRLVHLQHAKQTHRPELAAFPFELRQQMKQPLDVLLAKAQGGDPEAQYVLGFKYLVGNAIPINDHEAYRWIRASADQGYRKAFRAMGDLYMHGWGTSMDVKQAFQWYEKGAQLGEPKAEVALGWLYLRGQGVPKNDKVALAWIQKAVMQGLPSAMAVLGRMYADGSGVAQDDTKAIEWYRKAAEKGDPWGQFYLGYCYMTGRGVPKDYVQAARLLEAAGLHGNAGAQFNMGFLYTKGQGVRKDAAQAHAWLLLSAARGNENAERAVDWDKTHLSVREIDDGKDSASRYEEQIIVLAGEPNTPVKDSTHLQSSTGPSTYNTPMATSQGAASTESLKPFVKKSAVIVMINIKRLTPQYRYRDHCWMQSDMEIVRYLKGIDAYERSAFLAENPICHDDVSQPGRYLAVDWYDPPNAFRSQGGVLIADEGIRANQQHKVYFFQIDERGLVDWTAERSQVRKFTPLADFEKAINTNQL